MKRFVVVVTLTCLFSVSALAGDIPTIGAPAPAPTTQSSIAATVILAIISLVRG
jgi:hypothetical protein